MTSLKAVIYMLHNLSEIKGKEKKVFGAKAYNLSVLLSHGINVPDGYCIDGNIFHPIVRKYLDKYNKEIFLSVGRSNFLLELDKQIKKIDLNIITDNLRFPLIIRSSFSVEDNNKNSFAGIFSSFSGLNSKTELFCSISNCISSIFNDRFWNYIGDTNDKFKVVNIIPSIIIQEFYNAEVSGVCFTKDPISGISCVIESGWGIGDSIVGGKITPDHYKILDNKIITKRLGAKLLKTVFLANKITTLKCSEEESNSFTLNQKQVLELYKICNAIEKIFQYPQDIEWLLFENKFFIVQSRSITTLKI